MASVGKASQPVGGIPGSGIYGIFFRQAAAPGVGWYEPSFTVTTNEWRTEANDFNRGAGLQFAAQKRIKLWNSLLGASSIQSGDNVQMRVRNLTDAVTIWTGTLRTAGATSGQWEESGDPLANYVLPAARDLGVSLYLPRANADGTGLISLSAE